MAKDVMVHLDGGPEDDIRLQYAQTFAAGGRAHVIGVYTNLLPDLTMAMPFDGGAIAVQALTEIEEKARREGDQTVLRLQERLSSLPVPSELRRIDESFGPLALRVAEMARCADLFITTRPGGEKETTPAFGRDLVEEVLFGGGRALLLVPPGGPAKGLPGTVLIAWNGSRESARALSEAMSLIEQASRVIVLSVDAGDHQDPAREVLDHLSRHGVSAEAVAAESEDREIADVILDQASRFSADLIVMGGYGHSRLREQILGGVTESLLALSSRPLLVAH